MEQKFIHIENAYLHNLQISELKIPLNKFVVITGTSGSGKTTLINNVIVAQSQMLNNLDNSNHLYNLYQNYSNLRVRGLTPVKYLEQRFSNKRKRLNLAQFLEIETQINLLYANFAKFDQQEIDQAYSPKDIKNLIPALPKLTQEMLGYRNLRYRYLLSIPFPLPILPGLTDLEFPAKKRDPQQIVKRNKQIVKALFEYNSAPPDTIILNKSIVYDIDDLYGEVEELEFAINSIDFVFVAIDKENNIPDHFEKTLSNALATEAEDFRKIFLKHAGLETPLGDLGLDTSKLSAQAQEGKYTNAVEQALRSKYQPSIGVYSPFTQQVKDYPLVAVVKDGDKEVKAFNLRERNAFSTFGQNRCQHCNGTGYVDTKNKSEELDTICPECHGVGLASYITQASILEQEYQDLFTQPLHRVHDFFQRYLKHAEQSLDLKTMQQQKATLDLPMLQVALIKDILARLQHVLDMNLTYISLSRKVHTFSGGEIQRIQLSKVLNNEITGVTYILDEPSIGLHPQDNRRLIDKLRLLVQRGNSVIVVEHDNDFILYADHIISLNAGRIEFEGTVEQLMRQDLPLTQYLNNQVPISQALSLLNNKEYNNRLDAIKNLTEQDSLRSVLVNTDFNVDTEISLPLAKKQANALKMTFAEYLSANNRPDYSKKPKLVYEGVNVGYFNESKIQIVRQGLNVISGVSGSGKSIFASHILYAATNAALKMSKKDFTPTGALPIAFKNLYKVKKIIGANLKNTTTINDDFIDIVLFTHQIPDNRNVTLMDYIDITEKIATLFEEASKRKHKIKHLAKEEFLLNNRQTKNKCPQCIGKRVISMEIERNVSEEITCFECKGTGYANYVLAEYLSYDKNSTVEYNIADFYSLNINQAYDFFTKYHKNHASSVLKRIIVSLAYLKRFRLGHLVLGRSIQEISGGEMQRLYLIKNISINKLQDKHALIVIDEPTTGLHFDDIQSLLDFLIELRDQGHTIVVIEHNLDIIYNADHYIEFGPGAAEKGGQVIFAGSIAKVIEQVEQTNTQDKEATPDRAEAPVISSMMQDIYTYHQKTQANLELEK
ncbi:excinuclease ABC subunit UvrA [Psittacicella hinzii]|uniref:UvrABC system protein A n=1 Tax=Psittacicella hinzii TaxID=2028575 RepID=A0A3A1YCU0_9GAMM|nr:hypothetical protein [Psittacicella hinzii]RIY35039.1 hypothetical protein CKF58_07210 [Psittacicella hinzii]